MSTVQAKLQPLSNDKYTIEFVKSSLNKSFAVKDLESEINSLINFFAWKKQILYFQTIQAAFRTETSLEKIQFSPVEGVPKEIQFFVVDGVDQVLEDLQKRMTDEGYKSEDNDNEIFIDSGEYRNWKDILQAVIQKFVANAVNSMFISKTISIILNYIASLRDVTTPSSEAELNFNQDDKNLKQALLEYKATNQSKRKTQFLISELHSIIDKVVTNGDPRQHKKILQTAIKYGYPLPLSAAPFIAIAMDKYLTKSGIYKAGIDLQIKDNEGKFLVEFKTRREETYSNNLNKGKVYMRQFNGSVFLCQSDYRACIGMLDQMHDEVDQSFFYEAFTGYLKNSLKFPRQAESLREGILEEIELL
ncbi:unnamed protein product [Adineta ricciae]|nr:unnamed protein product [Adineta ricciae]